MNMPNKRLLQHLAPIDNADTDKLYSSELKHGIDDQNIKNIALTGAYGSGKSSIIKTFETRYGHKHNKENGVKLLNISLAEFENSTINKNSIDIERSILQKIFYSVKDEDIPYSRFKRIKDIDNKDIKKYSALGFIWLIVFYIAYENSDLPYFLEPIKSNYIYTIALIFTFLGILLVFPKLFEFFGRLNISKINIKDGELDLAEKPETSILNKNLDEIIYFFKSTKYQVVIFEDLDRVSAAKEKSNIDIFMKLREINLILNNSEEIEHNITFIYAIKDDNFQGENRIKFFDLIIPVIPFVDYSNSAEQLRVMINNYKENKEDVVLDSKFINKISLYIDNMRLLINIFNEFIIYKEQLKNSQLQNEKLFSMIVYKNLSPYDFSELCLNKGNIYKVIENKKLLLKAQLKEIEQIIAEKENAIKNIENEFIESIEELRAIFIYYILKQVGIHNNRINVDGSHMIVNGLIDNVNFDKLYNANQINSEMNTARHSFESLEKSMSGKRYKERAELIELRISGKIEALKQEISEEVRRRDLIATRSLKDLVDESAFSDIKDGNQLSLLTFLISNGYIDESYKHYISLFHENSITKEDRDYILSVIEKRDNLGYDYKLSKVEQIMEQLENPDFRQKSALNFYTLDYLFENRNTDNLEGSFEQFMIQVDDAQNLKFIDEYIEYKDGNLSNESKFEICNRFLWLFNSVENSNFLQEKKDKYLHMILEYTNLSSLIDINSNKEIERILNNKGDFLSFTQNIDNKKIKDVISALDVRFNILEVKQANKELFEFIYKNNNYVITFEFIEKIIQYFDENNCDLTFLSSQNFTTINKSSCEHLKIYIEDNINDYIKDVFLTCKTNINESEAIIIRLINNKNIHDELKIEILDKVTTKIVDIKTIEDTNFWTPILEKNKTLSSWENISKYFNKNNKQLDQALIDFLNYTENYEALLNVRIDKKYTDNNSDFETQLLREIIQNNSFSLEAYKNLITGHGFYYSNLDISGLDEDKISILIQDIVFKFDSDNFKLLKQNGNKQHIAFLIKHIDDFIKEIQNNDILKSKFLFDIDTDDTIELLSASHKDISKANKKEIIENMNYNLISNSKIAGLIFNNKDRNKPASFEYIYNMVNHLDLLENKIKIIAEQKNHLSSEKIVSLLALLPDGYDKKEFTELEIQEFEKDNKIYNKSFAELIREKELVVSDEEK